MPTAGQHRKARSTAEGVAGRRGQSRRRAHGPAGPGAGETQRSRPLTGRHRRCRPAVTARRIVEVFVAVTPVNAFWAPDAFVAAPEQGRRALPPRAPTLRRPGPPPLELCREYSLANSPGKSRSGTARQSSAHPSSAESSSAAAAYSTLSKFQPAAAASKEPGPGPLDSHRFSFRPGHIRRRGRVNRRGARPKQ